MELTPEKSGDYGFNVVLGNVTAGTEKPSIACRLQWNSVSGDESVSGTAKAQMSVGSSTAQIDINYSMNEDVELNDAGDAMTVSAGVTAGSNSITLKRSYSLEDVITTAYIAGWNAAAGKVAMDTLTVPAPTESTAGSTNTLGFSIGTNGSNVEAKISYGNTSSTKAMTIGVTLSTEEKDSTYTVTAEATAKAANVTTTMATDSVSRTISTTHTMNAIETSKTLYESSTAFTVKATTSYYLYTTTAGYSTASLHITGLDAGSYNITGTSYAPTQFTVVD